MRDGKFVIFCVDDDQDILDAVRMILEPSGYLVEQANSAKEALEKFEEVNPDFALIDMMMEKTDAGLKLAAELKKGRPDMPVFLLSSVGDGLASEMMPQDVSLDGVFQKPVNPKRLLSSIKSKLGNPK